MPKRNMKNKLYPGKPNYTGPTKGWFTLLHHEGPLLEWSDNVMERIDFIRREKAKSEIPVRLRHIVAFPDSAWTPSMQKARAKRQKAHAKWYKAEAECQEADAKWDKAHAKRYKAEAECQEAYAKWYKADADAECQEAYAKTVSVYLHQHVTDCKWNGKELV